ncbi:peptide/nickel transport system ATP-binding protein/oligopeptide transport system ATP-binding protein [Bacillus pakistanensis]|uniref:Peptide/nickel transport system ATP-binding protein/oligopeptide transport system ATP-binding protein n=1 Tax=Rossellomorea pakistanensis TaxID=992288 RepID=A0ABS2NCW1_9BACI|nr:ABC transporter ATP-binding protein [Bacillus pakistanensis]MBM7585708.1 peptide/nickel transport system ATP-binding protein/oligopeptide transport system ATP-binding protein [Bacillus pakistanensis]
MSKEVVLEVSNLKTHFSSKNGVTKAVDGIDFVLHESETLGIVGESGCGKSMTSLSILRLVPSPPGEIVDGTISLKGKNILQMSEKEMRHVRGNQISMIFQEPMTSLNPVIPVGEQIAEAIRVHQRLNKKEAWKKAVEMLELVGIPSPEKRAKQEPFQLSGGMRQRVMIAMALACNPEVLIADEPTTALDVTIQAQILKLMKDLQKKLNMGIIFITHDLGVVAELCDKVAVMYAGQIVEYSTAEQLFTNPKHPYTSGLMSSLPKLHEDQEELQTMKGNVPSPYDMPKGCRFSPRCPLATAQCHVEEPSLNTLDDGSQIRCFLYSQNIQQKGVEAE